MDPKARNELILKLRKLIYLSDACLNSCSARYRPHGFTMVKEIAELELLLRRKGYNLEANKLNSLINKCLTCIKVTATTGRTYFCIKKELERILKEHEFINENMESFEKIILDEANVESQ